MKRESYYTAEIVTFATTALMATALIWLSLAGAETAGDVLATGVTWLVISLACILEGIRRQPLIGSGQEVRPGFIVAIGLVLLAVAFLLVAFGDSVGPAQILHSLILFAVAVFTLFAAALQERRAWKREDAWRDV